MIFKEYLRLGTKMRGERVKLKKNDRRVAIKEAIELNPSSLIMNCVRSLM